MLTTEIAKIAGVSPATVSRVLSNNPAVSPKSINKVKQALAKKGINLEVQRKRAGTRIFRTRNVAVLLLSKDALHSYSTIYMKTITGVENALNELHANMIYSEVFTTEQLPPCVLNRNVDGLILTGTQPSKEVLEKIKNIPTVWLCSHQEETNSVALGGNDIIAQIAVKYLTGKGHKHVAAINAFQGHPALETRCEFFNYFAMRSGVQATILQFPITRKPSEMSMNELYNDLTVLIEKMLNMNDKPTGLFFPIDVEVAMAYEILNKHNIKIGKDVEIIGCDNDIVALLGLHPRPATIDINAYTMGRRAVKELIWKLENPNSTEIPIRVIVEPKLIPGE